MKIIVLLLAVVCGGISAHAQASYTNLVMTTSNLLGYWRFSPASQANSSFGTNTGTFSGDAQVGPTGSGPAFLDTPANTAVLLDGNGDFVTTTLIGGLNTNGPYANQGSIIGWFKLATLPSTTGRAFYIEGESQVGNDLDLQIHPDNKIYFFTDSGSYTVSSNALTSADTNVWHFVAATFSANISRKIYLDGMLVGSAIPGNHNPAGNGTFSMGDSHVFTGRYFQGALDEVAIFNRELTGTEITNLYIASGYSPVSFFMPVCTNMTVTLSAGSNSCVVVTNDVTITNGLVAWFKADGNANDSYGTNSGTANGGVAYDSSQSGQAFKIEPQPASQDVDIGGLNGLDNATGFTISAYVKLLPSTNNFFYVFSQAELPAANPSQGSQAQSFNFSAGTNFFQMAMPFANSSNTFTASIRADVTLSNQWKHLAATWRNSDGLMVMYADGVQVGSTNFAAGAMIPFSTNNPGTPPGQVVRIGSALIGAGNYGIAGVTGPITGFSTTGGDIDNLRLYTRALSAAEIQQIMQADSGATVTNCTTIGATTTNLNLCTTLPGELTILNSSPGNVSLVWPRQNNAFYLLQSSDALTPLAWTQLWAGAGNGTNVIVTDPTIPRPKRFYRLLSNEQ